MVAGMALSRDSHPLDQSTRVASSILGKENDHAGGEVGSVAGNSAPTHESTICADDTKEKDSHRSDGVENKEAQMHDPDVLRCEHQEASPDVDTDKEERIFTERIIPASTTDNSIGILAISTDGRDPANSGIDGVEIIIEMKKEEEAVDVDQECVLNGSHAVEVGVQIGSGHHDGDVPIAPVNEEEGDQVRKGVAYGRLDGSAGTCGLEVSELGAPTPVDTMQKANEAESQVSEMDNRTLDDQNDEVAIQGVKAAKKRARGQWEDTQKASRAKTIDEGTSEVVGDAENNVIARQERLSNAVNSNAKVGDGEAANAQNVAPSIISETSSGSDGKGGKDDLSDSMNAERKRARGVDLSSQDVKFLPTPLSSSQEEVVGLGKPSMMQDARDTLVDENGVGKSQDDAGAKDCEGNEEVELDGGCREETVTSQEVREGEEKRTATSRSRPPKRRKIAILVAYCGAGYQGMQKNPGAVTIEGLLEEALFKAGAIPENHFGDPRKVDWMRAARTDKGVSAVGQVVSGLFCVDPPGFVERVNSYLPKQIRVIGYKRVIPTFSAKKYCDRRRYEYVIPVFAFDPSAHRDRESVLASEGQGEALTKCQECSERGRKVPGAVGKQQVRSASLSNDGDELGVVSVGKAITGEEANISIVVEGGGTMKEIPLALVSDRECGGTAVVISMDGNLNCTLGSKEAVVQGKTESLNGQHIVESIITERGMEERDRSKQSNQTPMKVEKEEERAQIPSSFLQERSSSSELTETSVSEPHFQAGLRGREENRHFKFGEEQQSRFNRILRCFVGTHNFHNFTTRIKAEDPSAKRYIVSFEASEVFTVGNMEFVRCTIVGQSFMLHQIRKMIGLAVAIIRNCAPESMLVTALRRDVHMNIPTAPELGLFLDECMYPAYNQKWCKIHGEISQRGFEETITKFKNEFIYSHIAASEAKDGLMALFLHSLNDRNFPDFMTSREAEKLKAC